MTLEELKQVKADVANGIMVSKSSWSRVLDSAINAQTDLHRIWALIGNAHDADFFDKDMNDMDVDFQQVKMLLP